MAVDQAPDTCPIEATLNVIGGKWKPMILFYLLENDVMRFNELRRAIPQVTQRMLTRHLRELEADGVIHREVYPVVPPHVEYSVTDFGKTLQPVLDTMLQWGLDFMESNAVAEG